MQYWNEFRDASGYIHSIDNILCDYYLRCSYQGFEKLLLDALSDIDGFDADTQSSLDNYPSFKYQFYVDMVWFDGVTVYLGKYATYDKVDKSWTKLDMMRLKVNPNKHMDSEFLKRLLALMQVWCADGYLVRYDYAVDVPCKPSDVLVVGSRKEPGLYKGTRYYGQRHKHGHCKIYDKQKEQLLDEPLTRIEYTYEALKEPSVDNIVIRAPQTQGTADSGDLRSARLYLDMLLEIQALGGNMEPYIERMNYRTYKKIEPFLYTGERLQLDKTVLDKLINNIVDAFIITHIEQKTSGEKIETDKDGFMIALDTDLPFN